MEKKILIVDDEAHIRFLIEQALEELEDEGVELFFSENGVEALNSIRDEQPDLVFLDVMMPQMNGFEVCQKLKEQPPVHLPYIIILTAKGKESNWEHSSELGANEYLTKPFDPDNLLKKAQEILGLS